jgi:C-terminal processing protease CtpA/Prc
VSLTQVVEVDGRRVGYLFFRNFVRPSVDALNEAFAALKAAGATELVLDVRYNGGGLVDVAVHLASLIGGTRTNGQVLLNWIHNDRVGPSLNKVTRFNDAPEQALNLQRLVVITTRSSASASELIINSLRPYMPVAVIGDSTYGKPVGQYGFTFCDKVLAAVAFSLKNANHEGDFFDGIAPTCAAADDATHQLGDPAEGSYAEALTWLRTGACSPRAEGTARAMRARVDVMPRAVGWDALINAQ